MKTLTLGLRLGLSFGALILLIGVFGGLAVWRINLAATIAMDLAIKRAPEVAVANNVQKDTWETRFNMRQFFITGNTEYLRKGRKALSQVKEDLKTADELVKTHRDMTALSQAATLFRDKMSDFETLVDQMEAEYKNIAVLMTGLDTAGKILSDSCVALRISQRRQMEGEIDGKAAPEKMKERIVKMALMENLIDTGNSIRIASFKSLDANDMDALRGVLKYFDTLGDDIARLAPLLQRQEDIDQLAKVKEGASDYRAAMEGILKSETAIRKARDTAIIAGTAVTDASANLSDNGVGAIGKAATDMAGGLSLTSVILLVGLVIALIAGVLIAWLSARAITGPIREGMSTLASTAAQMLATVSQLASNASETAAAVAETTTTLDEVRQTAQVAADKAKAVADNARGAALAAETGRQATEQTVRGLKLIRDQMCSIGESITRLHERSQAVGDIVSTVADLAEQSNLLAVNASIEAAKAGDMGKGFAVVAQEIRNLAEQSKDSTKQVRAILSEVQKATGKAVLAAEQGSKSVADGGRQADEAGQAIGTLTGTVQEATRAAVQIAASSQQQLVGMEQVGRAMENIKQATAQNAEGARQLATAAHSLQEVGARLKTLVDAGGNGKLETRNSKLEN